MPYYHKYNLKEMIIEQISENDDEDILQSWQRWMIFLQPLISIFSLISYVIYFVYRVKVNYKYAVKLKRPWGPWLFIVAESITCSMLKSESII
jgi:hypothetical protein